MRTISILLLIVSSQFALGDCPGGNCPTAPMMQVKPAPVVVNINQAHWTYPGDITTHLRTAHGQNVSGLSHEQQLTLHDSLHNGTANVSRKTYYVAPRKVLFWRWRR